MLTRLALLPVCPCAICGEDAIVERPERPGRDPIERRADVKAVVLGRGRCAVDWTMM
jgi:hypothetical protein